MHVFLQKLYRAFYTAFVSPRFWLVLLLLLAWVLRLYHLGSMSLWWDESLSWDRATSPLAAVLSNTIQIQNVTTRDLHPPFYFLLLHGLVQVAGVTEFALRFLSAGANVLTLALLAPLTRVLFAGRGTRIGLLTVLFAAVSPFYVWYAQEARPYALILLVSVFTLYALLRWLKTAPGDWRDFGSRWFILFVVGLTFSFATLYLSFVLLPFYAATVLIFGEHGRAWRVRLKSPPSLFAALMVAAFGIILLLLPRETDITSWEQAGPLSVPFVLMLRDMWNSFSVGLSMNFDQAVWFDLFFLAVWLAGILALVRARERGTRLALFFVCYLFLPAVALQLGSFIRPLYLNSRHLITTSPAFYIGLAVGVDALARGLRSTRFKNSIFAKNRILETGIAAFLILAILAGSLYSLKNLYFDETFAKDDHKGWAQFLRERLRPDDYLLLVAPQASKIVEYYAPEGLQWESLPTLGVTRDDQEWMDRQAVLKALGEHPRVWLLELHHPVADPNLHILDLLTRWSLPNDGISFRGVSTEIGLRSFVYGPYTQEPEKPLTGAQRILFTRKLQLYGFEAPAEIKAGTRTAMNLYWRMLRKTSKDVNASLRVVDEKGTVWGQWDAPPVGNLQPLSSWDLGVTMFDQHDLVVDPGAPPGRYFIELGVYTTQGGKRWRAIHGGEKNDSALRLAEITVTRPTAPLESQALMMDGHADETFGETLRFIGYDLEERTTNPGSDIPVTLYFQVRETPGETQQGLVTLGAPWWKFWDRTGVSAPFTLDLAHRQPGDIVQTRVTVRVPGDMSAGEYDVRLMLDGLARQANIPAQDYTFTTMRVDPLARSTDLPSIAHPVQARFGDKVEFLGYALDAPQPLKRNDPMRLTLYWRALAPMNTSYTVFAHLINGDDKIYGQKDKLPLDGARPTTSWAPGEIFSDTYEFNVASDAPPGAYRLETGLYNAADFTRLPTFDENGSPLGDRILFEDLRVE